MSPSSLPRNDHAALLRANDPAIFAAIDGEERRLASGVEMIPSENHT